MMVTAMKRGVALMLWAAMLTAAHAEDVVIRVPAGGGTAAVMKALKQAREARAALPPASTGAIRIVFPPGEYPIFETVQLTPDDSGTAAMPTVLEAEVPGKAVWVGAVRLNDPTPASKPAGAWRYSLEGIRHRVDARDGGQFYVGEQRAVLARMPNQGSDWTVSANFVDGGKAQFVASAAQARWLDEALEGQRPRAILHLMQSWTSGRHRVGEVSPQQVVRITPAANWPFLHFGPNQRFFVQNVRAALDAPGEWLEEGDGVLYVPRDPQERTRTGYLAVNPLLLQLKGRPDRNDWVEHVQIKGLAFAYALHELMGERAQQDWQAAVKVGAAIEVSGARKVSFQDCQVSHTGGHGLWLRDGVQHVDVQRCVFQDLGAGGIKVGEAEVPKAGRLATGFTRLIDNVVSRTGQDFPGAVGIWIGHSFGNIVQGNVVANTSYSGISVGWQWGYGAATSGDNEVRHNVLWNIGQGQMADLAGIYTLGRSPGTVIAGNFIRRVRGYPYGAGAWGIYNDEGSSEMRVEGNVVVDAESGGYHLHYGRSLSLSGNFFLLGGASEINWTNVQRSGGLKLDDNVMVVQGERPWAASVDSPDLLAKGNVVGVTTKADLGLSCPRGCQAPALVSVQGLSGDVAQLDVDGLSAERRKALKAVVQRAQQTVGQARLRAGPDVFPNAGGPLLSMSKAERRAAAVSLDFASAALGAHPSPLRYSPSSRLELAQVDVADASGDGPARCLRLTDGVPGLAGFDPHVFLDLRATSGTLVAEFDVWVDSQTELVHEWRDDGQPFKAGPIVTLRGDGVSVGGRTLMGWRPNAWYRIKVSAPLGRQDTTFDLSVTADGKVRSWRNLPMARSGWRDVAWMGWVSATQQRARTCLGSIKVVNE